MPASLALPHQDFANALCRHVDVWMRQPLGFTQSNKLQDQAEDAMAEQGMAKSALGRIGIWAASLRYSPGAPEAAQELEKLGFKSVWMPGGADDGVLAAAEKLLEVTASLIVASGILNIWKHEPADVVSWWRGLPAAAQARFMLGLGVSHSMLIGEAYQKPLTKMRGYLDGLDQAGMPRGQMCLAALGPKMLQLAQARTAGAHPYLVTPRHSAFARKTMGPDALLAPEQGVVLETDPGKARQLARGVVKFYAALPNYSNNWRREGYTDTDIETLSDHLIDGLIAWGDLEAIGARVQEHLQAGADHVCLQVIGPGGMAAELDYDQAAWRKLATLL
jgi:probable F420-dependent oxidoreductase